MSPARDSGADRSFLAWADLIFPFGVRPRLMAMFGSYFDDSTTPGTDSRVLSVGCYVATDKRWARFRKQWSDLLSRRVPRGRLPVPYLRMADLANKWGPFKGWTAKDERIFVRRAHAIIRGLTQAGVVISLDLPAYEKILRGTAAELGGPYAFCAFHCIQFIRAWAEQRGFVDPIACVFERSSGYGKELFDMEQWIKNSPPLLRQLRQFREEPWGFVDKIKFPQLQAADVYTYEANKFWYNEFHSTKKRPVRRSVKNLVRIDRPGRHFGDYFDEARLLEFRADILGLKTE